MEATAGNRIANDSPSSSSSHRVTTTDDDGLAQIATEGDDEGADRQSAIADRRRSVKQFARVSVTDSARMLMDLGV